MPISTPRKNTSLPEPGRNCLRPWRSAFCPIWCLALLFAATAGHAQPTELATRYVSEASRLMAIANYPEAAVTFNKAIAEGLQDPYVYRELSIALYNMYLVDDCVAAMEKAVALAPEDNFMNMELGILYLTQDRFAEAETLLCTVLRNNPGLSEAYYFLGELFFRKKRFNLAWIAARTAEKLGFESSLLLDKLSRSAAEPGQYPWQQSRQTLALRQIELNSREEAQSVLERLGRGELFEYTMMPGATGPGERLGLYLGEFKPEDLRPEIAAALQGREIYSAPVLVNIGESFLIVQPILSFDFDQWLTLAGEGPRAATGTEQTIKPGLAEESLIRLAVDPLKVRIHAGAYLGRQAAILEVENLRKLGYPAFLLVREKNDGTTWHYVIAGQYDTRKQAETILEQLKKQGHNSFIVPAREK